MSLAYYNEHDSYAAHWLRNLIAAGHIAPGVVDERDIRDVRPEELIGFTQVHMFAGIGVWSHALRSAGWSDDRPIWSGSCPCQPFSAAGRAGGFTDERHLWPHWHWLIEQCGPAAIVGEQVTSKTADEWYDLIQTDLEAMGYAFGCVPLPAASVGAPHIRDRGYWFAYAERDEQSRQKSRGRPTGRMGRPQQPFSWDRPWPIALAEFRTLDDGITRSVATTDAYRNALVGPIAQAFCEVVKEICDG